MIEILRETGLMSENFVGTCFYKWFIAGDGAGRKFLGTVRGVWWESEKEVFFARVEYEHGDAEDITLAELAKLVNERTVHERSHEGLDDDFEWEWKKQHLFVDSNNFVFGKICPVQKSDCWTTRFDYT